MKIVLLTIGKTSEKYLIEGIAQYQKRLKHYTQFEMIEIANLKLIVESSDKKRVKMVKVVRKPNS